MATSTVDQTANAAPASQNGNNETEVFKQSYSFRIPRNMDGVQEVFTDPKSGKLNEKALVYVIRAGIKQIGNNRLRQRLTEKDDNGKPKFEPIDGTFDVTELLHEAPQRQVLSQRDKLKKNLEASSLPAAVIETMLATFDANVGTDTGSAGNVSVDTNEASVVLQGAGDKAKLVMRTGAPATDEDEE